MGDKNICVPEGGRGWRLDCSVFEEERETHPERGSDKTPAPWGIGSGHRISRWRTEVWDQSEMIRKEKGWVLPDPALPHFLLSSYASSAG